ncbi:MAG: AAA family ATPase [Thermodesulfovibrio sp.]|nr:AAA family ATPase [Thermodesulfovibrio sp.]
MTEEEAKKGEVIKICLEEIYKCMESPLFFIGILGGRYGWIPTERELQIRNSLEADGRFTGLLKKYPLDKTSVTELEIRYGVLENPRVGENLIVHIYVRDEEESERVLNELGIKQTEEEKERQRKLIEELKKYPKIKIREYKTAEELIALIEEDLKADIERLFPKDKLLSYIEKQRWLNRTYAKSRLKAYVEDHEILNQIDQTLKRESGYLLIHGESGIGKSSLIAYYSDLLRKKDKESLIIEHYTASGSDSPNYINIMHRLIGELENYLGEYKSEDKGVEIKESFDKQRTIELKLRDRLIELFEKASLRDSMVYIFLDGLNLLYPEKAKQLYWLPAKLPKGVYLIMSTISEDKETMESVKYWLKPDVITLKGLDKDRKAKIIKNYLSLHGKKLEREYEEIIIQAKNTDNPLFLKALLDELRVFGEFERLGNKLRELIKSETVEELFEKIFSRCKKDYGEYVIDILILLNISRDGINESELLDILPKITNREITRLELSTFILATDSYLVDINGYYKPAHYYVERAIGKFYDEGKERDYRKFLVEYFKSFMDSKDANYERISRELPWQLYELRDSERLTEVLKNMEILNRLLSNEREGELSKYVVFLEMKDDLKELVNWIIRSKNIYMKFNLGHFLYQRFAMIAQLIYENLIEELKNLYQKDPAKWAEDYTKSLNNLAVVYKARNELDKAIELTTEALKILKELYQKDPAKWAEDYTTSLNNLAVVYEARNELDKAIELTTEALKILEEHYTEESDKWIELKIESLIIHALCLLHLDVNRASEILNEAFNISDYFFRKDPSKWKEKHITTMEFLFQFYEALYTEDPNVWKEKYKEYLVTGAEIYRHLNILEKALELEEKVKEIEENQSNGNSDRF